MEETIMQGIILIVGWPLLIIMSILILLKARNFHNALDKTVPGKLIFPTVFGWIFGMVSLGVVSTAYIFSAPWYYTIAPVFVVFLVAIVFVFDTMRKWEKEAKELQAFYSNLEKLVKERTAQLEESQGKAIQHEKEIQVLKDQFVFIAAHELRTPVTAIKWELEAIADEGQKKIGKELYGQIMSVRDMNERLIGLVEDLLNVARIESKTIKLNVEDCDISELILKLSKEQKAMAVQSKVTVKVNLCKNLKIQTDSLRIKQIVTNLLSNAIKYNKENGTVKLELIKKETGVDIIVADTGIGIAESDLSILYTKFGRIKTKETANIEGTGLGLFVTKQLITQLGGDISVKSQVGVGTTFIVSLPYFVPEP